jgi:hypothetical protein
MRPAKRERLSAKPQRLPNGQWRCETGSAVGGKHWCPRPATLVIEGLTTACPGAITCTECRAAEEEQYPFRRRVKYVPFDNPPPASAGEETDDGR